MVDSKDTLKLKVDGQTKTFLVDTKGYVLDNPFPYGRKDDDPAVYNPGSTPQDTDDTPNIAVFKKEALTYAQSKAFFSMYILFMPPGRNSNWIPLRRLDWSWKGEAEKKEGRWGLVSGSPPNPNPNHRVTSIEDTDHPKWKKNYGAIEPEPVP